MNKPTVTLKGVELRWAYLGEPNNKGEYASGKYQVDVILNEAQKALVETLPRSKKQNIVALEGDDAGRYKVTLKSGMEPRVVNADCIRMTPEELKKVGNGTIANMKVVSYSARGQDFIGLGDIRITSLSEYSANSFEDLMDDEDDAVFASNNEDDDDLS